MAFNEFECALSSKLQTRYTLLSQIWESLGLTEDEMRTRSGEVVDHVDSLLHDLIKDEKLQRDQIVTLIEENRIKVEKMAKELDVDVKVDFQCPLLQLDADLETRRIELEELREARLHQKLELESRIELLAESHILDPNLAHSFLEDQNISQHAIDKLKHVVTAYERELEEMKNEIQATYEIIMSISDEIAYEAEDDFELAVLDDLDSLPVSQENFSLLKKFLLKLEDRKQNLSDHIKSLWTDIRSRWIDLEMENNHIKSVCASLGTNIDRQTDTIPPNGEVVKLLRDETKHLDRLENAKLPIILPKRFKHLVQLWKKCYICATEQKQFCQLHGCENLSVGEEWISIPEEHRGETLTAIDSEIEVLTKFHHDNKEIFRCVSTIEGYRNATASVSDEDRLRNRGGILAKLERMKKTAKMAERKITEWEAASGQTLKIHGTEYLNCLTRERQAQLEREQSQAEERRKKAKSQVEHELRYGSMPVTPRKTQIQTPSSNVVAKRTIAEIYENREAKTPKKRKALADRNQKAENRRASLKPLFTKRHLQDLDAIQVDSSCLGGKDSSGLMVLSPSSFERELEHNLQSTRLDTGRDM